MFCQRDLVTHRVSEFLPLTWPFQFRPSGEPQLKCLCKLFLQELWASIYKAVQMVL